MTDAANEQHYEVPARFFEAVLGPYLKYSCGYWPSPTTTFEESEVEMLELYCERAQLRDGMNVCRKLWAEFCVVETLIDFLSFSSVYVHNRLSTLAADGAL